MRLRLIATAALALSAARTASLFAQCPDGTPPPCAAARGRGPAANSIAVLHFDNLSRDTTDLYLIEGLAEELTGRLGAITRLRVTGRSVARRAQLAAAGDALAAGRALNVRYLVEGSLRRSGARVRVSARLLRASDGVLVWSDDYNRTMDDLLALQEELASQVASSVAGQLLPDERTALAARPTTNPAAYDHYLRGRYLLLRRTFASITQGAAEFDEARRLDPRFTGAEALRASALVLAYAYGVQLAAADSLAAMGRRSAERALRLDSTNADAWIAIAQVATWFPPVDLEAALRAAERATTLDPRNADAHHYLGIVLQSMPDGLERAEVSFRRALAIDPDRAVSWLDLAEIRAVQGRFDASRALLDTALALDPQQPRLYFMRSGLRYRAGDVAGARADAETLLRLSGPTRIRVLGLAQLTLFDKLGGDSAAGRARLAEIESTPVPWPLLHAMALANMGMTDSATAVLGRGPMLPVDFRLVDLPMFDALRSAPGYQRAITSWKTRRIRT